MSNSLWVVFLVIALACGYSVVSGFNNAANDVATVIGTRSLSPRKVIIMAAILKFIGAATGLEIARTIGKSILAPEAISYQVAIAGLLSIIIWGTYATHRGLPISLTHGLVSGLAGAGIGFLGIRAIDWRVMATILLVVITAPFLGFVSGFGTTIILYRLSRRMTPTRAHRVFSRLEILSSAFASYTHGLMDGQYAIGIITMALVLYTGATDLWEHIPSWVILLSAFSISFGTALGGWQVIKTLSMRVTALHPLEGFAAEFSAAMVVELASLLGIPTSSTHCIAAAIMGVGSTKGMSAVRWGVVKYIFNGWVLTFPICGFLGFVFAWLLKVIF